MGLLFSLPAPTLGRPTPGARRCAAAVLRDRGKSGEGVAGRFPKIGIVGFHRLFQARAHVATSGRYLPESDRSNAANENRRIALQLRDEPIQYVGCAGPHPSQAGDSRRAHKRIGIIQRGKKRTGSVRDARVKIAKTVKRLAPLER